MSDNIRIYGLKKSEIFWAILLTTIQIGLACISYAMFEGVAIITFILGLIFLADIFGDDIYDDDTPIWEYCNWLVIVILILLFLIVCFIKIVHYTIIIPLRKFNNWIDGL